jgi:uncharacterized protein (TIGR02453 family)
MKHPVLPAASLEFLRLLGDNNSREWFAANKDAYLKELAAVESFSDALLTDLNTHDIIETPSAKRSLYRIYRDVRFSKDKTPFSTYWGGRFRRAGKQHRGGYYYHWELGNKSFVLCGFWGPSAPDLKLIREDIAFDAAPLRAVLSSATFVRNFGTLQGEQLKTTPKGYPADHDAIDLLRYKQFLVMRRFTDEELLSPGFIKLAGQVFRNMRPFFNHMSEVLSTDMNGAAL